MIGLYVLLGGMALTVGVITLLDELARRQDRRRAPRS